MCHEPGINEAYQKLSKRADMLYDFVNRYHNYMYGSHHYGAEQKFNMMEIHTLTYIEDHPGVTITELAKNWRKTKSALSQAVKKLVDNGYVEKRHGEKNSKSILLYVTPKGKDLSYVHKAYDVADITQTSSYLNAKCGEADVEAFYRVLATYIQLLDEG